MISREHAFGFLTRHEDDEFAQEFHELTSGNSVSPYREQVISYLKQGHLCIAWMGFVVDMDNPDEKDEASEAALDAAEVMGYSAVYTDGTWFWPEYIIGYLKKYPQFYINPAFIEHIKNHDFSPPSLTKEQLSEIEKELDVIFRSN